MAVFDDVEVLSVHHWTERLFSFTTTRSPSLRFSNGQFTLIGMQINGKRVVRAYSMVSPNHQETLEFLSIKIADGPLTSRLQHIQPGDTLIAGHRPTGTLVVDNLLPGQRLYLLATGTGIAPFMAIIRDPQTYERFAEVILVHGCRYVRELAYKDYIKRQLPQEEFIGPMVAAQLKYYPTITREPFTTQGRIPELIESGQLAADLNLPALNPQVDRVMICGGPYMLKSVKQVLLERGFTEGSAARPGDFVIERSFADQ